MSWTSCGAAAGEDEDSERRFATSDADVMAWFVGLRVLQRFDHVVTTAPSQKRLGVIPRKLTSASEQLA